MKKKLILGLFILTAYSYYLRSMHYLNDRQILSEFFCEQCIDVNPFASEEEFKDHLRTSHLSCVTAIMCFYKNCNKICLSYEIDNHLKSHITEQQSNQINFGQQFSYAMTNLNPLTPIQSYDVPYKKQRFDNNNESLNIEYGLKAAALTKSFDWNSVSGSTENNLPDQALRKLDLSVEASAKSEPCHSSSYCRPELSGDTINQSFPFKGLADKIYNKVSGKDLPEQPSNAQKTKLLNYTDYNVDPSQEELLRKIFKERYLQENKKLPTTCCNEFFIYEKEYFNHLTNPTHPLEPLTSKTSENDLFAELESFDGKSFDSANKGRNRAHSKSHHSSPHNTPALSKAKTHKETISQLVNNLKQKELYR